MDDDLLESLGIRIYNDDAEQKFALHAGAAAAAAAAAAGGGSAAAAAAASASLPPYAEFIVNNAHGLHTPAIRSLREVPIYTQDGAVKCFPPAPDDLFANPAALAPASPLPFMLRFSIPDLLAAPRDVRTGRITDPATPNGFVRVDTSAATHRRFVNLDRAAADTGYPEGGAVFSSAPGIWGIHALMKPPPPIAPVVAAAPAPAGAKAPSAASSSRGAHLARQTWTCAAVAAHEGHAGAAISEHDCVKSGRTRLADVHTARCRRVPVSSDCAPTELLNAAAVQAALVYWACVRRFWFYNRETDRFVVAFPPGSLYEQTEVMYVFLAVALGFRVRVPAAGSGASPAVTTAVRRALACVDARTGEVNQVDLDEAAASLMSPRTFVTFVNERLYMSAFSSAPGHPFEEALRPAERPWIDHKFRPARALAEGRVYPRFEKPAASRDKARRSTGFFTHIGFFMCGVPANIQRLQYDLNTEAPRVATATYCGQFQQRHINTLHDKLAWWYMVHLYLRPNRPLLIFDQPCLGARVSAVPLRAPLRAPDFENLGVAATRVTDALSCLTSIRVESDKSPPTLAIRQARTLRPTAKAIKQMRAEHNKLLRHLRALQQADEERRKYDGDELDAEEAAAMDVTADMTDEQWNAHMAELDRRRAEYGEFLDDDADADADDDADANANAGVGVGTRPSSAEQRREEDAAAEARIRKAREDVEASERRLASLDGASAPLVRRLPPDWRVLRFLRWHWAKRTDQGAEASVPQVAQLRRTPTMPLADLLLWNAHHPLSQFVVSLCNTWIRAGFFGPASARAKLKQERIVSPADLLMLDCVAGEDAFDVRTESLRLRDVPLPETVWRSHVLLWDALHEERARTDRALGADRNFLGAPDAASLPWVFAVANRIGISNETVWYLLLFYAFLRHAPQEFMATRRSAPVPQTAAGAAAAADADDDMPLFSTRGAAAAAAAEAAPNDLRASPSPEDALSVPRAALPCASLWPDGLQRTLPTTGPGAARGFGPWPSTVAFLLRTLAADWDAAFVRVPAWDPHRVLPETETRTRLARFVSETLGEGETLAAMQAWAVEVTTPARFSVYESRQYGAAMNALVCAAAERYVARTGTWQSVLARHGARLVFEGERVEVQTEIIAMALEAADPDASRTQPAPRRRRAANAVRTLEQRRVEVARRRAEFGVLLKALMCACGQDDARTVGASTVASWAAQVVQTSQAQRDAAAHAAAAAARGATTVARAGETAVATPDELARVGSAAAANVDAMDTDEDVPIFEAGQCTRVGGFAVMVGSAEVPLATVMHWIAEAVVQPVVRLVLTVFHPPMAAASTLGEPDEWTVGGTMQRIQTQRLYIGRSHFLALELASLSTFGAGIDGLVRRLLSQLGRIVNPKENPAEARRILLDSLKSGDEQIRMAANAALLFFAPMIQQRRLPAPPAVSANEAAAEAAAAAAAAAAADDAEEADDANVGTSSGKRKAPAVRPVGEDEEEEDSGVIAAAATGARSAVAAAAASSARASKRARRDATGADAGAGARAAGEGARVRKSRTDTSAVEAEHWLCIIEQIRKDLGIGQYAKRRAVAVVHAQPALAVLDAPRSHQQQLLDALDRASDAAQPHTYGLTGDMGIRTPHEAIEWMKWAALRVATTDPAELQPSLLATMALMSGLGFTEDAARDPRVERVMTSLTVCAAHLMPPVIAGLAGGAGTINGLAGIADRAAAAGAAGVAGAVDEEAWNRHSLVAFTILGVLQTVYDAPGLAGAPQAALRQAICAHARAVSSVGDPATVPPAVAAAEARIASLRAQLENTRARTESVRQTDFTAKISALPTAAARDAAREQAHQARDRISAEEDAAIRRRQGALRALRLEAEQLDAAITDAQRELDAARAAVPTRLRYPLRADGADRHPLTLALLMFIGARFCGSAPLPSDTRLYRVEYAQRDAALLRAYLPANLVVEAPQPQLPAPRPQPSRAAVVPSGPPRRSYVPGVRATDPAMPQPKQLVAPPRDTPAPRATRATAAVPPKAAAVAPAPAPVPTPAPSPSPSPSPPPLPACLSMFGVAMVPYDSNADQGGDIHSSASSARAVVRTLTNTMGILESARRLIPDQPMPAAAAAGISGVAAADTPASASQQPVKAPPLGPAAPFRAPDLGFPQTGSMESFVV